MARTNIELAKLIENVADQLRSARDAAAKTDPIIDLAEVELELAVEVTSDGGAGIRVWVFELGGRHTKSNTNTVRVKFTPHGALPVAFELRQAGAGPELGRKPDQEPDQEPDRKPDHEPDRKPDGEPDHEPDH